MRMVLGRNHIQAQIILLVFLTVRLPRIRKHLRIHRHIHDRIQVLHNLVGLVDGRSALGEVSFEGAGLHFLETDGEGAVVEARSDGLAGEVQCGRAGGAVIVDIHNRDLWERVRCDFGVESWPGMGEVVPE